jgi:hypothetical protein
MLDIPGRIPLLDALSNSNYTLTITPVGAPEPSSIFLLSAGIVVLLLTRKRSARA